jgi:hypothetical protein
MELNNGPCVISSLYLTPIRPDSPHICQGRIQAVSQPQGLNNMPNVPSEASQNKRLLSLRPEEMFQPILPKVDHILSLLQEQQEQMLKANGRTSDAMEVEGQTNGVQAGNQEVDLEDKIYKEVSSHQSSFSQAIRLTIRGYTAGISYSSASEQSKECSV